MDAGRITGIGGIFVKSPDPAALSAWYCDVLGLDVASWGGAKLPTDDPRRPRTAVWTPFRESTDHFLPSTREVMVNFSVDDLDALLARLADHGVTPLDRMAAEGQGRFAWILDPDGTKLEFWEPEPG